MVLPISRTIRMPQLVRVMISRNTYPEKISLVQTSDSRAAVIRLIRVKYRLILLLSRSMDRNRQPPRTEQSMTIMNRKAVRPSRTPARISLPQGAENSPML